MVFLDQDEVVLFVAREGMPDEKVGPVEWPGEVLGGQEMAVKFDGRTARYRVLAVRLGDGGRFVRVEELAGRA